MASMNESVAHEGTELLSAVVDQVDDEIRDQSAQTLPIMSSAGHSDELQHQSAHPTSNLASEQQTDEPEDQPVQSSPSSGPPPPDDVDKRLERPVSATTITVDSKQKLQAQDSNGVEGVDSVKADENEDLPWDEQTIRDIMAVAQWWKYPYDDPQNPHCPFYWISMSNHEIKRWDEPNEPSWLVNPKTNLPVKNGIVIKGQTNNNAAEELGLPQGEYKGYNPALHGPVFDPTADYAKWHKQAAAEAANESNPYNGQFTTFSAAEPADYASTMALNRFSGNVQGGENAAERHTGEAKAGRQMGAFFDVDEAANAHGGRSLKEERRQHKATKDEVVEWRRKKKEKKRKKLLAKYA